jgi:hypothetical protein
MNNPSLPEPPWQRLQAAIGSCSGALFYSLPTCKHSCARLNTVVIPVTLANNGRRFAGAHAIAFAERSSCASCWTSPSDFISTCRCSIRSVKDAGLSTMDRSCRSLARSNAEDQLQSKRKSTKTACSSRQLGRLAQGGRL